MNKNKKSFIYFIVPGKKVTIKIDRIIKNHPVEIGTLRDKMKLKEFNKMSRSFKKDYPRLRAIQYLIAGKEILSSHKLEHDYFVEGA